MNTRAQRKGENVLPQPFTSACICPCAGRGPSACPGPRAACPRTTGGTTGRGRADGGSRTCRSGPAPTLSTGLQTVLPLLHLLLVARYCVHRYIIWAAGVYGLRGATRAAYARDGMENPGHEKMAGACLPLKIRRGSEPDDRRRFGERRDNGGRVWGFLTIL
jgi:hypothetical protein